MIVVTLSDDLYPLAGEDSEVSRACVSGEVNGTGTSKDKGVPIFHSFLHTHTVLFVLHMQSTSAPFLLSTSILTARKRPRGQTTDKENPPKKKKKTGG